jgi:hypothetical protein
MNTRQIETMNALTNDLVEARIAIRFLMRQVEHLANLYMESEVDEWLAKNDAMNCGRRALGEASNPQEQASTTAKTLTEEEREDCARWFDDKEQADNDAGYLDERDARWNAARNL